MPDLQAENESQGMMVLCSNHSSKAFIAYARQHVGKVGWIIGPSYWKVPRRDVPYALDNDAFIAWKNGTEWDAKAWRKMLWKTEHAVSPPMWVLIPDMVANREVTLEKWDRHSPEVIMRGWKTTFAVQDGMSLSDVPKNADVIFIGGTTSWKWRSASDWCHYFPRVHIGRVRTLKLEIAERLGAESVDGSGFMRETFNGRPSQLLRNFVEGHRNGTPEFPKLMNDL